MAELHTTLSRRVRGFVATPQFARLCRYAAVSVISTVLSLSLLFLFFDVAKVSSVDANIAATVIATIPSYFLTRNWTWGKSGRSHLVREVIPFWVIALVSLVLSTYAVGFGDREAKRISHAHVVETVFVLGANFLTYGVIWVVKYIIFNRVLFATPVEGGQPEPALVSTNEGA